MNHEIRDQRVASQRDTLRGETRRRARAYHIIRDVSTTLDGAISSEDPCFLMLISLLSPYGIGMSRIYCFSYDDTNGVLHGHMGYDPGSAAESAVIHKSIIKAFRKINGIAENPSYQRARTTSLSEILGSQRQTIYQYLQNVTRHIRPIIIDFSQEVQRDEKNLLSYACKYRCVVHAQKSSVEGDLPRALLDMLDESFAIIPVSYHDMLYYVIFTDKRFHAGGLQADDLLNLEWFRMHASLVVRNSRLFKELKIAYEETRQIDDLKTNFLSIISHELRTPLTSIYGFLELLQSGKAGEMSLAQNQLIDRAIQNAQVMITKVDDLIELAKFEIEGMENLELEPVDPLGVLIKTMSHLEKRAKNRSITMEPVLTGDLPRILSNEPALIKIYTQLLDNAIKFSSPGSRVEITFKSHNNKIAVSFTDKGPGIPKDKLQKIFEYFYQIEEPMTRTSEGMGIGLSMTRYLLKATGGSMEIDSTVGKGSTFTVIYPIAL